MASFFLYVPKDIDNLESLIGRSDTEQIIYYPYGLDKKNKSSLIKPDESAYENLESYIHDESKIFLAPSFNNDAKEILNTQRKILVLYLTNNLNIDISFKLLTLNGNLKEHFAFGRYYDPDNTFLEAFGINNDSLPRIGVVAPGDAVNDEFQYPLFLYSSEKFLYMELVAYLKSIEINMKDELLDSKQKNNSTVPELRSYKDFEHYCAKTTSLCIIALLSAEAANKKLNEQIDILHKIKEKKANSPLVVMWINATCHKEIMESFDIEEINIPTIVALSPTKGYIMYALIVCCSFFNLSKTSIGDMPSSPISNKGM